VVDNRPCLELELLNISQTVVLEYPSTPMVSRLSHIWSLIMINSVLHEWLVPTSLLDHAEVGQACG
jgi:hypothetical protein